MFSRLLPVGLLVFILMAFCMPTYYTPETAGPSTLTAERGHQYFFQIDGRVKPVGITLIKSGASCQDGAGLCATIKVSQNNGNNAPLGITRPATEEVTVADGGSITLWKETDLQATYNAATKEVVFSWGDRITLMKMHYLIDRLLPKTVTAEK